MMATDATPWAPRPGRPALAAISRTKGRPARLLSRATEVEGEGDVTVGSAAFLEGVEPPSGAAGVKVAAARVPPRDVALSPFVPLSGVVLAAGDLDAQA